MTTEDTEIETPPAIGRWEKLVDVPLLVLALASIPLVVVEDIGHGAVAQGATIANWVIWAFFLVDLTVRTWLVRHNRMRYLVVHWYAVGIIVLSVLPYFRPLRILRSARALRVLRAARVIVYAMRSWHTVVRLWGGLVGKTLVVVIPAIVAAGAGGVWIVERDGNGEINSYGDAAWWAVTTVTTVGYGDIAPVTVEGRLIAAVLMVTGIAAFGVVTANIAGAMTTKRDTPNDVDARIDELLAAVNELKQQRL